MARELLRSQPFTLHVRLLQHAQVPRPLLDLLSDERARTQGSLGHQGRPQRIRTPQERLPRYAGAQERLQAVDQYG